MKRGLAVGGLLTVLAVSGLALAQQPSSPDVIGDLLTQPPAPAGKAEEPPPGFTQVPTTLPPVTEAVTVAPVLPAPPPPSAAVSGMRSGVAPSVRPRYPVALLQVVDKITAETFRFDAPVGQARRYKSLVVSVKACETTAANETRSDAMAHVEIKSRTTSAGNREVATSKTIFRGWMFAQSPSLSPLEHPIYDVWLIACRGPLPAKTPVAAAPKPKPKTLGAGAVQSAPPSSTETDLQR